MAVSDPGPGDTTTESRRARAEAVKEYATSINADLVGIADIDELEANPPNPEEPQLPSRIWPDEPRSAVVLGKRMPMGEFFSDHQQSRATFNSRIMEKLGLITHRVGRFIEDEFDAKSLVVHGEDNHPAYKGGAYGPMSMRHMAAEAGLGTFGLEANLLTPEYGPRVYFEAVFTTADIEPDGLMTEQVCIGETCGRCLMSCPTDAVKQFDLEKVACSNAAQVHGFRSIYFGILRSIAENAGRVDDDVLLDMLDNDEMRQKFHSVANLINAFGACPRCVEVCPIGKDYHKFIQQHHRNIPEKTKEKEDKLKEMFEAREHGDFVDWNKPVSERWIGVDGYRPFRAILDERAEAENPPGEQS